MTNAPSRQPDRQSDGGTDRQTEETPSAEDQIDRQNAMTPADREAWMLQQYAEMAELRRIEETAKKRLDETMKEIEKFLNDRVSTKRGSEGFFYREFMTILRGELESQLKPSVQRFIFGQGIAEGMTSRDYESNKIYEGLELTKTMLMGRIDVIIYLSDRIEGREGDKKIPPSELIRRWGDIMGEMVKYADLLNPPAGQEKKYKDVEDFLKSMLGVEGAERPPNKRIVEHIVAEFPKGEKGLMPFIWMAMQSLREDEEKRERGNKEKGELRVLVEQSLLKLGNNKRAFLEEGAKRGVIPPSMIRELRKQEEFAEELNFTPEEIAAMDKAWDALKQFNEQISSQGGNIYDNPGALAEIGVKGWGLLVVLANVVANTSSGSVLGSLKAIGKNPYVWLGVGAMALPNILRRGLGESKEEREEREEIEWREALKGYDELSDKSIDDFLRNDAGTGEKFERGNALHEYARGFGERANCKGFLMYLVYIRNGSDKKEIYDGIIKDFLKIVMEFEDHEISELGDLGTIDIGFNDLDEHLQAKINDTNKDASFKRMARAFSLLSDMRTTNDRQDYIRAFEDATSPEPPIAT